MIKKLAILTLPVLILFLVVVPAPALVQSDISVTGSSVRVNFPLTLDFSAQVKSDSGISDIRLRYKVEQISYVDVTNEALVNFAPSKSVNVSYTLDMRKSGGLPTGAIMNYWWLVKNARGDSLETTAVRLQFDDNRFNWRNTSQGKISIFWYNGDNAFASDLMNTAQQALVRLSKDTGASLDRPVRIFIYSGAGDLQSAMVFPQEWTGGAAYSQNSVIVIGIAPNALAWGRGAMTHELAHIVVFQMTVNPYNEIPVWLNEGFAMYAEGALSPQYTSPLIKAVKQNSLLSVRSLSSPFSAITETSLLSYAQSYSLVDYLVSQYGSSNMLELFNTFKQGSDYDSAFSRVYGFDMDGLNAKWRENAKATYGGLN